MTCKVIELRTVAGQVEARELRRPLPEGFVAAGGRVMASVEVIHDPDDPGSFEQRVLAKRVDLVALIEHGVPPIEYLPGSDGMLARGKRHLIAAPRKEGKSIAMLVHWARMALAGARVIVLDRENGSGLYAARLEAIVSAWDLTPKARKRLQRNLDYYEFPRLRPNDGTALVWLATGADVVVFDAQRMFLTDFGLREGESDDYAEFMAYAVEPLFQAGVATVILDNTGHSNQERSRGSSAKGDLNEVLFTLKSEVKFSLHRQGKVRLILDPGNSRFGNEGVWEMHIGGGAYSTWQRVDKATQADDPEFRRAVVEALRAAGAAGLTMNKLLTAVREAGVSFSNEPGRARLYAYAADPAVPVLMFEGEGKGHPTTFHYSK